MHRSLPLWTIFLTNHGSKMVELVYQHIIHPQYQYWHHRSGNYILLLICHRVWSSHIWFKDKWGNNCLGQMTNKIYPGGCVSLQISLSTLSLIWLYYPSNAAIIKRIFLSKNINSDLLPCFKKNILLRKTYSPAVVAEWPKY